MAQAKKILVSIPDDKRLEVIKQFLVQEGHSLDVAYSGKDAQLKLYNEKYFAFVLDAETKNHSAFEVLRYLKSTKPILKTIFSFKDRNTFNELEMSEKELSHLGISDLLFFPLNFDKFRKCLEGENQFEGWKNLKPSGKNDCLEEVIADNEFTRLSLSEFFNGNRSIFDFYIRITKNKYVKILLKGDVFDHNRLLKFQADGVEHLYFRTADRGSYINFLGSLLESLQKKETSSTKLKFKISKQASEFLIDEIFANGFQPALIDEGKKICGNVYRTIQKDKVLQKTLFGFFELEPTAQNHACLVSFLSTLISLKLDWVGPKSIEILSMGSIFHDIGKIKIPRELLNLRPHEMNPEQLALYRQHPALGAELLHGKSNILPGVMQVVAEHHEFIDGSGYPKALTLHHIYPLAKVVSLADSFANFLLQEKLPPMDAARKFLDAKETKIHFDKIIIEAFINVFITINDQKVGA